MPTVKGKKYPYTKAGKKAAKKAMNTKNAANGKENVNPDGSSKLS